MTAGCLGALAYTPSASATVTSLYEQVIIVAHPQTADLCFREVPVLGDFGIAPANMMLGTFGEYRVPYLPTPEGRTTNINVVATNPQMVPTYRHDTFDEETGLTTYRMTLDVSALAAAEGERPEDRQRVMDFVKLGLLAMAQNMDRSFEGRYHLWVEIIGLPEQRDLKGARVHATTTQPYTAGSPLLAVYADELIDVDGTCD